MRDWLKPLFVYRRYIVAGKILKDCFSSYAIMSSEPHEPKFETIRQYPNVTVFANFLSSRKIGGQEMVLSAINLLKSNKHITTNQTIDIHKMTIKGTDEGKQADLDGYYQNEVYKFWFKFIGVTGAGGIIFWILNRLL